MSDLIPERPDLAIARILAGGLDHQPATGCFVERRFPPPESVNLGGNWLAAPVAAILACLSACGAPTCHNPAVYAAIADGSLLTACAEHACKLATVINDHARCPACHVKWTYSEQPEPRTT